MIDGQPNRKAPTTVAAVKAPIARLTVWSAYTMCTTVTSEGAGEASAA